MKRVCVLIVAGWCVCLTASLDWSQSGVLRSSDFGSHAMQGQEIVVGVQPGMLVKG